jgi:hypothetical protein
MQFLKAHYEKIILSIVLMGLAAAAALMPMKVSQEREKEEARKAELIGKKVIPFPTIDLSTNLAALDRLDKTEHLKLAGEHNLFNPVRWQRRPDGGIQKGATTGLNAVKITNITPLKLKVFFDGVTGDPGNLRYVIAVVKETERPGKQPRTTTKGGSTTFFVLDDIEGPPENPTAVKLTLKKPDGTKEKDPIIVTPQQPYERVIAYSADLSYEPEQLVKKSLRVRDEITFGGETYNVVAITPNEVVLSAKSNKKQTPIEFKPPEMNK